jgi:hypothetical protein
MTGLVPAIHVLPVIKTWMPGTRPGMTNFARRAVFRRVRYTLKIVSPNTSSTRKITTKT